MDGKRRIKPFSLMGAVDYNEQTNKKKKKERKGKKKGRAERYCSPEVQRLSHIVKEEKGRGGKQKLNIMDIVALGDL